jgi:hypothetical protein
MLALTIGVILMSGDNNNERQRKFLSKMYKAGFKRIYIWVKKEPDKSTLNISKDFFYKKLEQLIAKFNPGEQSKLFNLILKILEGKKEVLKLRKEEKADTP